MPLNELLTTMDRALSSRAASRVVSGLDVFGTPTAPLELVMYLDSYLPSLMPRTSQLQGMAAGLNLITARAAGGTVDIVHRALLGSAPRPGALIGLRAAEIAAGHAVASLPERDDETLWRSGLRTGGEAVKYAAIGGALHDTVHHLRNRHGAPSSARLLASGAMASAGLAVWASRRLAVRRREVKRWPVVQEATIGRSIVNAAVAAGTGTALAGACSLTGRAFRSYFGDGPGKAFVAGAANLAVWAAGLTGLYNAGIARIGSANEKVEPGYARPPQSPFVSGSPESLSPYAELGMQGRRYVSEVVTPQLIGEVIGEPAVDHPIRAYIGFNSAPLYSSGRAELAIDELDRMGAFDRSRLLLVSPTGTGWVDHTVVEAAEFFAKGDIATCCIQYGRFPSFLCVQKVGLGRIQFRLLLWGIRQRLAERPPERRPKVLVFGESLGAWTASDVVMSQGIPGFDHYGIDRALWFGLPALAKWSRNGMAGGSSDLVPEGTVGVFDRPEQLAALSADERDRLRAVILSHDNDPIAALRPELAIREPDWLRGERGRNVPEGMDWIPLVTFWQVAIDAANAMNAVPGDFRSFGHDYRGDTARFVRDAFHLPVTGEEVTERIDQALRTLEIERKERIRAETFDAAPLTPADRHTEDRFRGGVPVEVAEASGPHWFRKRPQGSLDEDGHTSEQASVTP